MSTTSALPSQPALTAGLLPLVAVPWAVEISQRAITTGSLHLGLWSDFWLLGAAEVLPFLVLAFGLTRIARTPAHGRRAALGVALLGLVVGVYSAGIDQLAEGLSVRAFTLLGELMITLIAVGLTVLVAYAEWDHAALVRGALVAFAVSELIRLSVYLGVRTQVADGMVTSSGLVSWLPLILGVLLPVPAVAGGYVAWRFRQA